MEPKQFAHHQEETEEEGLEDYLESEFAQQPEGSLLIRRCCICRGIEVGDKVFPQERYEGVLAGFAREYKLVVPGQPVSLHPIKFDFTDTILSKECLTRHMVGQPRYFQRDGLTFPGRYSLEDVQQMSTYQLIPRERCH